jgi:PAS domain S-box-containing protein
LWWRGTSAGRESPARTPPWSHDFGGRLAEMKLAKSLLSRSHRWFAACLAAAVIWSGLTAWICLADSSAEPAMSDIVAVWLSGLVVLAGAAWALHRVARKNVGSLSAQPPEFVELFDSLLEGIGLVDENEIVLHCNPAFARIFGHDLAENMVGRCILDFLDSSQKAVMKKESAGRRQFKSSKYQLKLTLPGGINKTVLVSASPRFDRTGKFAGSFAALMEITDMQQAAEERERLLRDKEQRVRELSCLYSVARLLRQRRSLDAVFRGVAAVIPSGFAYGHAAQAKIRYRGREYVARPFTDSKRKMAGEILVEGRLEGFAEIHLSDDCVVAEDHAFSRGERSLIDAVARALSQTIESRLMEQRLAGVTRDWQATFDIITDAILLLDSDFRIVRANHAAQELFEPEPGLDSALNDLVVLTSGGKDDSDSSFHRCLESGRPLRVERYYNALQRYFEINVFPRPDESGQAEGLVVLLRDITERIRNEQEMVKLFTAVNQSASMICITDTRGVIEFVNPQFSQVTGYDLAEVVGKPISILKSGRQRPETYKELWSTIEAGRIWSGRLQNKRKNGEIYWEHQKITPLRNEKGEIVSYLAVKEDITADLKAQQKLMESDKLAAIGTLAAGVAHEFKNALGGIIGNASFALEQFEALDGADISRRTLEDIISIGEQANQVAMSLLTYSRANTDEYGTESLQKIIEQTRSLVERGLHKRSIELVVYCDDVPPVEMIPGKIQQLLLNLIINAEQAIGEGGVITISLTRDENLAHLTVNDTGRGIPHDNLPLVFDPFFSTKGVWGRDDVVGSGMGLAICRNVAREHGGDLTVTSIEGVGSSFSLSLPLIHGAQAADIVAAHGVQSPRILLFTLDRNVIGRYFAPSCRARADILMIDSLDKAGSVFQNSVHLAVLDARFAGKIELWRTAELCLKSHTPYLVINCGEREYQMADVYEHSQGNFKGLPEFERILEIVSIGQPQPS